MNMFWGVWGNVGWGFGGRLPKKMNITVTLVCSFLPSDLNLGSLTWSWRRLCCTCPWHWFVHFFTPSDLSSLPFEREMAYIGELSGEAKQNVLTNFEVFLGRLCWAWPWHWFVYFLLSDLGSPEQQSEVFWKWVTYVGEFFGGSLCWTWPWHWFVYFLCTM